MKNFVKTVLFAFVLTSSAAFTFAQDEGQLVKVEKPATSTIIPVSISGFSGEAAAVIKFDLEVLGIVDQGSANAQYFITGSNNGNLEGRLTDINKTTHVNKTYQGASTRALAHAFAQDVVNYLRPGLKPIFKSKVAFRAEQSPRSAEIGVADFDGYGATLVTHDGTLVSTPAFSPAGRKLYYTSWKNGIDIFEQDVASGARKVFAKYPGANYSPAISPDGRRVAMILNKGGSPDLYVCNIDGSGLKQLTHSRDDESSPCWSPDSQTICYVVRSGRAALWKVNADGGTAKRISTAGAGGNITEPDWSPDGTTIIFTSMTGGFNLFKVNAAGGTAEPLVSGEDASWAANSRTVIFTRRENGRRVLSLLDVPTKHVKDVGLKISGSVSQPSWAR